MIIKQIKKINQEVIDEVLCNKCGKSLVHSRSKVNNPVRLDHGEVFLNIYGLSNGIVTGGYESTHLEDTVQYEFSLCEECLSNLFETFKIPVSKTGGHL